jgi:IS605 OrfB family transposase
MCANENENLSEKTRELELNKKNLLSSIQLDSNDKKKDKLKKDLEKINKDISKLNIEVKKEASKLIQDFFGCTEQNIGYRALSRFEIPSAITACISNNVVAHLKSEFVDVAKGDRSIRNYSKSTPIPSMKNTFRFHEEHGSFYLGWRLRDDFNFQFRCRAKGELISSLRKVISGEYKMCDSSVQVDGRDVYCLLSLDIPNRTNVLDTEKVLGVDLGIKFPAYYATNFSNWIKGGIGSIDSFLKVRMSLQKQKQQAQKSGVLARGGKGRTKKIALKNRCGIIKLEKLKKDGFDQKLLRNWSYHELQTMIQYKAKMNGIQVMFINPAYTSQTCSECGCVDKENRKTQEKFKCTACGFEANADHNASINISKSEQYM